VSRKAGRYGDLDLPYIIAVNALADFAERTSVVEALFGTEYIAVEEVDGVWRDPEVRRNLDGVWRGPQGPINTRVSAVVSTQRLTLWSVAQRRARVTLNPWARRPFAASPFTVDRSWVENDRLHSADGRPLAEVFGLPAGWPE